MSKVCAVHFIDNCALCGANRVTQEVVPQPTLNVPEQEQNPPLTPPEPTKIPEREQIHGKLPKFASPIAQKVIQAAQDYSMALETVNSISMEVEQLTVRLSVGKQKLDEARQELLKAKKLLNELSGGDSE